jgi:hypothetical protein
MGGNCKAEMGMVLLVAPMCLVWFALMFLIAVTLWRDL